MEEKKKQRRSRTGRIRSRTGRTRRRRRSSPAEETAKSFTNSRKHGTMGKELFLLPREKCSGNSKVSHKKA
jgi:hypothetical protein